MVAHECSFYLLSQLLVALFFTSCSCSTTDGTPASYTFALDSRNLRVGADTRSSKVAIDRAERRLVHPAEEWARFVEETAEKAKVKKFNELLGEMGQTHKSWKERSEAQRLATSRYGKSLVKFIFGPNTPNELKEIFRQFAKEKWKETGESVGNVAKLLKINTMDEMKTDRFQLLLEYWAFVDPSLSVGAKDMYDALLPLFYGAHDFGTTFKEIEEQGSLQKDLMKALEMEIFRRYEAEEMGPDMVVGSVREAYAKYLKAKNAST